MKINRTSNNYAPKFCAIKNFKLPTKEVLECATGKLSPETINKPDGLFTIFSKLFSLKKSDIKDFTKTPMALDLYTISTGAMIRANNPAISKISVKLKEIPAAETAEEINKITKKIGNTLNIQIDDAITSYRVNNERISISKVWLE